MKEKVKKYDWSIVLTLAVLFYDLTIGVKCLFFPELLTRSTIIIIGLLFLLQAGSTIYDLLKNKKD